MIKFKRYPQRVGAPIDWTKRRASLAKSQPVRNAKKTSKKIPLFSEILEEEARGVTIDVEEAKQKRQDNQDSTIRKRRQFHAITWRKARKRFFECDEATQQAILDRWNSFVYRWMPKESTRFAGLVDELSGDKARRLLICEAQTEAIHQKVAQEIWDKANRQPALF